MIKDFNDWFNKLIDIWTDLTSFGYTAFWSSSISCKFSLIVCNLLYCVFLYVSVSTGYWCWINILSTHSFLCIIYIDDTTYMIEIKKNNEKNERDNEKQWKNISRNFAADIFWDSL